MLLTTHSAEVAGAVPLAKLHLAREYDSGSAVRALRDVLAAEHKFFERQARGALVEGLTETLQAEVLYEDQTMALPLTAMWDDPAGYYSVFFPTAAEGDYTFRIFGTIDGTEIDESFTSGPETFGPVEDPAPLRFPQ